MPQCNDPTDTHANIIYFRLWPIIYSTGPFPIESLAANLKNVRQSFGVIGVVTSGPNGDSFYEGGSYADAVSRGYTPPTPPPVGAIGDGGGISCFGPVPCPTGQHWDLDKNMCVPDLPAPPPPPPPPPPECPPGSSWDPLLGACVPDQPGEGGGGGGIGGGGGPIFPPVPPLPPPPKPPPIDGDEGAECCAMTAEYFYAIAQQLEYLAALVKISDQSQCCATIAATIGSVTLALEALAQVITKIEAPSDPVTCAQLTEQFDKLVAAINGGDVPANPTPPTAPALPVLPDYTLTEALSDIQTAIASMPFVDQGIP